MCKCMLHRCNTKIEYVLHATISSTYVRTNHELVIGWLAWQLYPQPTKIKAQI